MNEVDYFIKELDATRTAVAKFVDDTFEQVYVQENSNCQCPGAIYHKTQCKHLRIKKAWIELGKPIGYFTVNKKGEPTFHPNKDQDNTWLNQTPKS